MGVPEHARSNGRPKNPTLKSQESRPLSAHSSSPSNTFATCKRDKRHIKHASFLSRVTKTSSAISAEAQRNKRRRQKRQLVANLGSLGDALPDAAALSEHTTTTKVIRRKSIKSRPGAMMRREKVDKLERERFAKNLVQLAATKTTDDKAKAGRGENEEVSKQNGQQVHNRWTALRGFIADTMEPRSDMIKLAS